MSAPAANALSLPPRTMQRTSPSRSSSCSVETSSSISSSESAFRASGRLSVTTAIAPFRSVRTSSLTLLLDEAPDRGFRLLCGHREREPVAGVVDRLVPREVAPEVEVLLRVAGRLRELAGEVLDHAVDLGVELRGRDDAVHEPPLLGLRG